MDIPNTERVKLKDFSTKDIFTGLSCSIWDIFIFRGEGSILREWGGSSCNRFTIIHKNEHAALALCDVDNLTEAAVTTVGLVVFNYLSSESKFQHGWYQIIDPITLPLSYVEWSV